MVRIRRDQAIPWFGPGCLVAALAGIAWQAQIFFETGILSSLLLGGSIALLVIGGFSTFYAFESKPKLASRIEEEVPTIEEFDRRFED